MLHTDTRQSTQFGACRLHSLFEVELYGKKEDDTKEEHMNSAQSRSRPFIKALPSHLRLATAACAWMTLAAGGASAQLAPNQTNGFGNGHLVTFTYLQNFDCVDEPTLDLDFNKIVAQSDPNEMQTPICQAVTETSADPPGGALAHTAHLYVLVPMFGTSMNPGDAMACPFVRPGELCGVALGQELIALFGHVPEAWMTTPTVATQCPDPNNPVPGTCTMHAS